MPAEYRKRGGLCQDGEAQFDKSVGEGLNYIIGSGNMGSRFGASGYDPTSRVQGYTRPLAASVLLIGKETLKKLSTSIRRNS